MLIKGTKDTPFVYISAETGKMELSGDSYSIKVNALYKEVFNWIEFEFSNINREITCRLYFNIINSETVRAILELIYRLNRLKESGKKINVIWEYDEDNEQIYEKGVDFSEFSKNPFILKKNIIESLPIGN
jgi:hypothetical protein